ncbi:MAG: Gfo/Idh/MocA family oxidoreductase [Alphaproteobacteria bacterium]|nr:Gfo/Idh/MocA family oxidoreductase [Alphaproteobacteria bacterium]
MRKRGIAIIGAGMIGAAHANGYRTLLPRFEKLIPGCCLHTVCDANAAAAQKLADNYGFAHVADDWRAVLDNPEVGIVSICLPNFLHVEATTEALKRGLHVLCEKPLALSAAQAQPLAELAAASSSISGTVFNYRRIPALAEIKNRLAAGDLGDPVQLMVGFQCDYAADPHLPHSWRYEFERAGPGALLDVGTHAADMARYLCGEVAEVRGAISTISIKSRFLPAEATVGHARGMLSDEARPVDNDDVMSALLRFNSGCQGFLTASRVAIGMGNALTVRLFGTKGTALFDLLKPSSYEIALFDGSGRSPFQSLYNVPASPGVAAHVAVPHDTVSVGYGEVFSMMMAEFLGCIAADRPFSNGSIADGYEVARILDAIQLAAMDGKAVKL